jgi:imidazolonepropionase
MTVVEALRGVTVNAAKALGIEHQVGTIEPGKTADVVVSDLPDFRHLAYRVAHNPCRTVVRHGKVVCSAS